ncbi:AbrB/MazE/SpoVT family DNA-binding domain-containing protein [Saccharolobus solfataricus]|nr:AbrB/MazE/SpoVT family DNA-binding domain-containing protein [Saccharolobus solfataricus]
MKTKVRVGKKLTIHIPKGIAEELNIREGDILGVFSCSHLIRYHIVKLN